MGLYKLRLLQGGLTLRKYRRWYTSMSRFRWRITMVAVVVVFPYRPLFTSWLNDFLYTWGFKIATIARPDGHEFWNIASFVSPT